MHRENWDDLRFVLAVAENGSVASAARALGVNHATVLRRIGAFEDRHGGELFERTVRGYSVPPERMRLIEAARAVEAAVLAVDRLLEGAQAPLTGVVRITSTDSLCATVLPPALAEIAAEASGLRLELQCSNSHLDLGRMQSDITVRPTPSLDDDLTGLRAGALDFAVYVAPRSDGRWLAPGRAQAKAQPAVWIAEHVPPSQIAGTADSFVSLREMAAAGMGWAFLPTILGEPDPRLDRLEGVAPPMSVPLWVATHADLADAPRVAVVRDRLAAALPEAVRAQVSRRA
ncbi:LysR family transcriptional regulator [Psychromarinibacter sp. C21-152]|uniref:LysR family transcriptional regulator n=1 Tax=Psychromarinibacter sediminicola TaxID=3033385 RepID=A0AAE3NWZ4_9RHOB|nr:LysR family transcriptional regulator [Psychromarinibacter sediminicola]MDF0603769.1 LysR family transcriptional regulator [Psychromarinibacter sediminicola]